MTDNAEIDWQEVSAESREELNSLGSFSPSVRGDLLKGRFDGDSDTYFNAADLRSLSDALKEAAEWLERHNG